MSALRYRSFRTIFRYANDMHQKKVTVKKVTGVKLVTLFILILAVTQHIH